MALTKEEIKALAEELKPSLLESLKPDAEKVIADNLNRTAPRIVQELQDTREFLVGKIKEHGKDLPQSLQRQFNTLVNTTITALSGTKNQVTRENIDDVLVKIKETNFDKELIDRERASENSASPDTSKPKEESKDDSKESERGEAKPKSDEQSGTGVRTADGTHIEMDKSKTASADGESEDKQDILDQFPLSNDEVYFEARKKKFLDSKTTGKGKSASDLVKGIDLNKYKTAQQ